MKHGPIALIDTDMPVVFVAPRDDVYRKVLSNMQEVKARGGHVIAVTTEGRDDLGTLVDHRLSVPATAPLLSPVLTTIPLQLLAYHLAVVRGCDVDRPRLAVEGEKELSDTFTVGPGRLLPLPGIGDVPLEGVLRTELQAYLTRRLAQNLNDPVVRAQAFVRLSIQGEVTRPGYYGIPAEALLSAALMAAGGTGTCAAG